MVTIRNYREEDFAAVCAAHDRARPDELIGSLPPEAFRPMAEVAEEDEFFASQTIVACDASGEVVGFASWRDAYITWLYVEPSLYRQGVGTILIREVLRRIGSEAWLNTLAGNRAAIAFYRKAGFNVVSANSNPRRTDTRADR